MVSFLKQLGGAIVFFSLILSTYLHEFQFDGNLKKKRIKNIT